MSKKGKVRPFPGPRGPQVRLPQPGAPAGPEGPAVRQKISEIDFYKYRLALSKEQGLVAKQETVNTYRNLLVREEENLKLRIQLLRMENMRDIGHLNLAQGDQVAQEGEEFFVVRAPRQGPVPPVNMPMPPAPKPAPEPPPAAELPPVPSAAPEAEYETEDDGGEETPEGN